MAKFNPIHTVHSTHIQNLTPFILFTNSHSKFNPIHLILFINPIHLILFINPIQLTVIVPNGTNPTEEINRWIMRPQHHHQLWYWATVQLTRFTAVSGRLLRTSQSHWCPVRAAWTQVEVLLYRLSVYQQLNATPRLLPLATRCHNPINYPLLPLATRCHNPINYPLCYP